MWELHSGALRPKGMLTTCAWADRSAPCTLTSLSGKRGPSMWWLLRGTEQLSLRSQQSPGLPWEFDQGPCPNLTEEKAELI